jgi:hypothetical protein
MSPELIAIVITSTVQIAGLLVLSWMARSMRNQMDANDPALFLQGRRTADIIREVRDSLRD